MKIKQTDVNNLYRDAYPCDMLYPMIEELKRTNANIKNKLKEIVDILINNDFWLSAYAVDEYRKGNEKMKAMPPITEWNDTDDFMPPPDGIYLNITTTVISFSCIFDFGSKDRKHLLNISLGLEEGDEILAPDYTDINFHSNSCYNKRITYTLFIDCRETGNEKRIEFGYDFDKLVKLLKMDYYEFMVCFKNGRVS